MQRSLSRLASLEPNYWVLPGHGESTVFPTRKAQSLSANPVNTGKDCYGSDTPSVTTTAMPWSSCSCPCFPRASRGRPVSTLQPGKTWLTASTQNTWTEKPSRPPGGFPPPKKPCGCARGLCSKSYYLAACQLLPVLPPWGALAGVRPTKLTTKHLLEGGTPRSADKMLKDVYYGHREPAEAGGGLFRFHRPGRPAAAAPGSSVYIGIPFCPSRCAYCSFVSRTIGKKTELLEPYLEALLSEIRLTGDLLRVSGKTIRSLYIGGGTPTTLSTPQMIRLLDAINQSFDLSRCLEFTVEGGRPGHSGRRKAPGHP